MSLHFLLPVQIVFPGCLLCIISPCAKNAFCIFRRGRITFAPIEWVFIFTRTKSTSMKKFLFFISLFCAVIYWSGCKKCFTCQNVCQQCSRTISSHVFLITLCRDSFSTDAAFNAAIAADTTQGYSCYSISPTYHEDFCVNKPGESSYPDYYNKGGRVTCNPK